MHLSDATPKNGIIDCSMCEKRFFIKDFIAEFTTNEPVKCIVEADAILSSGERKSKANILDLLEQHRELHEKLISEQNAFEAFSFDHFQEVCRVIELQREELKRTIDQIADEMIKKSKEKQTSFQQKHDQLVTVALYKLDDERTSLKDHFRSMDLTSESIKQLEEQQKQQIDQIQHKISQFNQMRPQVTSCTFEPNLDSFDGDNFGSLWLHARYCCEICNIKPLCDNPTRNRHVREQHNSGMTITTQYFSQMRHLQCIKCKENFIGYANLRAHYDSAHVTKIPAWS
jgi:molybdopterin converting factor small subunit